MAAQQMTEMSTATDADVERVARRVVLATADGVVLPGTGQVLLEGTDVTSVAVDDDGWWVLSEHARVQRVDGGAATEVAHLDADGSASCLVVHRGRVWVAGAGARLWRLDGHQLVSVGSFDRAPTHEQWHTPWGGPPDVFSMAVDGGELFVGVHVGGILRSADDGRTWAPTIDLHVDVHQVAVDPSGGLWAATGMRGLAHSSDHGQSWTYHDDGLHATYLLAVAATEDVVLVGASSGHAGTDGALYRFDGSSFERCERGLPRDLRGAVAPRHLVADGGDAAVVLPDGSVHASVDAGRTWVPIDLERRTVSEIHLL